MPFEGLFKPVLGGRFLTQPPWQGCSPSPREGRAGRGTGRGAVRTELLRIGFPLSLTLPTPSSWGEGNITGSLMVAVSTCVRLRLQKDAPAFRAHFTFAPGCR